MNLWPRIRNRIHGSWRPLVSLVVLGGWCLIVYVPITYLIAPITWRLFPQDRTAAVDEPRHAATKEHLIADPVNLKVVGSEAAIRKAFLAAGWTEADPITIKTSLQIALYSVLDRPYPDAPVSHLYLWGKPQDLAFQREERAGPQQRHHVRFWLSEGTGSPAQSLWYGAATYDQSVGVSHWTGQFTHHIAPKVDDERDVVVKVLMASRDSRLQWVADYQAADHGRNGGGDHYVTDRRLAFLWLAP